MLLSIGTHGNEVITLQAKLGLFPDGDFGPHTQEAVKAWQTKNGLVPDGIVGDDTWNTMFTEEKNIIANTSLDIYKLQGVISQKVIDQMFDAISKFNINNVYRLAHFLSQCSHESGNFSLTEENLNYSAARLVQIFPRLFTPTVAGYYAYQPILIGSRVYGNRMGNGDETSQEGWKYRGRGYIQLTGKSNYSVFSNHIGIDCVENPDLVATTYPLESAAYFFQINNIWPVCDAGASNAVITAVTKKINGGILGLGDRTWLFNKYYTLLVS
jgi:putative chitinase